MTVALDLAATVAALGAAFAFAAGIIVGACLAWGPDR